jgi:heme A synthase
MSDIAASAAGRSTGGGTETVFERGRFLLALAALAATGALILLGAQVTTTRAGDSVPSWPSSFFVPANRHQWFELGHRWVAGTAGLLTVALTFWCLGRERRPGVRILAVWCGVAVLVQAGLGGVRVLLGEGHHNGVPVAHTMLGQTFLALLTALATAMAPWFSRSVPTAAGVVSRRAAFLVGAIWCQSLLGAIQRHMIEDRGWTGVIAHVVGAFVVVFAAFRMIDAVLHAEGDPHHVRRPASWIGVLFVLQLLLGVFALLVTRGEDRYVNAQDVTSLFPTLHTLNGALLLALATVVAVRSRRVDLDPRRVFA